MKQRVIVVGMGSIGIRHARVCKRFESLDVEICDSRVEALAEATSALGPMKSWTSFSEAVSSSPEIMIIATPPSGHADMSCAAMNAGIDVLCEKPLSDTKINSQRIVETSKKTRRHFQVGFMMRYLPEVAQLRRFITEGQLGAIVSVRYHIGTYITLENSRSRYQSVQPGSLIMDYAHGLDLILWLKQQLPKGGYALGSTIDSLPLHSSPNVFTSILTLEDNSLVEIHMDYLTKPQIHSLHILGVHATATLDFSHGSLEMRFRESNRISSFQFPLERDDLYFFQMQDFLNRRSGISGFGCTAEEGSTSTSFIEMLLQAENSGQYNIFANNIS